MKKSLLVWGVLVVLALCFVGCCYYNTTHCSPCNQHCHHKPDCKDKSCPADDDTMETMTVEAVEVIPLGGNQGQPSATDSKTAKPATAPATAPAPAPANGAAAQ